MTPDDPQRVGRAEPDPGAGAPGSPFPREPLGGRFRIVEPLQTDSGEIESFRAEDLRSGSVVLLDLLDPRLAADPALASRFIGRALAAARLRHPALARTLDAGADQGWCYRAREYVEGTTLATIIHEHGRLPTPRALELSRQLTDVLIEAHGAGVTHYDIRPETLLLARDGALRAEAFAWSGLAAHPQPPSVPPELAAGGPADERAAVYLVESILYTLLTGQVWSPVLGARDGRVWVDPDALPAQGQAADPDAPPSLVHTLERALTQFPTDQRGGLLELRAALAEDGAAGGGTVAAGVGGGTPADAAWAAQRGGRGGRWQIATVAALVVVGLLALALLVPRLAGPPAATPASPATPATTAQAVAVVPSLAPTRPPPTVAPAAPPTVAAAQPPPPAAGCQNMAPWGMSARGTGTQPGAFAGPLGIALDAGGNLYVADTQNNRVQKLSPRGRPLAAWGRAGSGPGELRSPSGVAVDSTGAVYVADTGNNRVQRFSSDGQPSAALSGSGSDQGQMLSPLAVAVDALDNVYVADAGNRRVQKFSPVGEFLAAWGHEGSGPGELRQPSGLAVDKRGTVYVSDPGNHRIQAFTPAGAPLATLSLPGADWSPRGLALDARGSVFAAETSQHAIAGFGPDQQPLNAWNAQGALFAPLKQPLAVAIDGQGTMYVLDGAGPCIVRRFAPG